MEKSTTDEIVKITREKEKFVRVANICFNIQFMTVFAVIIIMVSSQLWNWDDLFFMKMLAIQGVIWAFARLIHYGCRINIERIDKELIFHNSKPR